MYIYIIPFTGGSKRETEWSQWANSEKEQLAIVMQRHGIDWEKKDTHEQHLSVMDYKVQQRKKELVALEEQCSTLETESTVMNEQLQSVDEALRAAQELLRVTEEEAIVAEEKAAVVKRKLSNLTSNMKQVEKYAAEYTHFPDGWLPEPNAFESAKSYRKRILPLITKVVEIIQPLYSSYIDMKRNSGNLKDRNSDLEGHIDRLSGKLNE